MVAHGRRRHLRNTLDLEGQHQTTKQHLAHQSECFFRGNAHASWHFDSPAFSQKQGDCIAIEINFYSGFQVCLVGPSPAMETSTWGVPLGIGGVLHPMNLVRGTEL